jgi:hypothetical protein
VYGAGCVGCGVWGVRTARRGTRAAPLEEPRTLNPQHPVVTTVDCVVNTVAGITVQILGVEVQNLGFVGCGAYELLGAVHALRPSRSPEPSAVKPQWSTLNPEP